MLRLAGVGFTHVLGSLFQRLRSDNPASVTRVRQP
jgi:hypothetical protein